MSLCHWYLDVVFANQTVSSHICSSSSPVNDTSNTKWSSYRVRWSFPSKKEPFHLFVVGESQFVSLECSFFIDGLFGHCVQNPELVNNLISIFSIGQLFQRCLILEVADWILSPCPLELSCPSSWSFPRSIRRIKKANTLISLMDNPHKSTIYRCSLIFPFKCHTGFPSYVWCHRRFSDQLCCDGPRGDTSEIRGMKFVWLLNHHVEVFLACYFLNHQYLITAS